jgi:nuclear transcription factor Y, gamma
MDPSQSGTPSLFPVMDIPVAYPPAAYPPCEVAVAAAAYPRLLYAPPDAAAAQQAAASQQQQQLLGAPVVWPPAAYPPGEVAVAAAAYPPQLYAPPDAAAAQQATAAQQQQQQLLGAPVRVACPPAAYPPGEVAGAAAYAPPDVAAVQQAAAAQKQKHQLQMLWLQLRREIEATTDFKKHNIPLSRIKKIMRADPDVCAITAEVLVVFPWACEMFILELTRHGWAHAEANKRRMLQKSDIVAAIARTDVFDFFRDTVLHDDAKEGADAAPAAAAAAEKAHPAAGAPATDPLANYPMPQQ